MGGFDYKTLLCLPFGLLLPVAIFIFLTLSKKKKAISYDSIFIGLGSFIASIAAVAVAFVIANMLFLSTLTFSDTESGMSIVGIILSVMVLVVYIVCESFKFSAIKKFQSADPPKAFSSLGFSAGVILAQNIGVFVALNIFSLYELSIGYALFSGAILLFTGVMYMVLSYSNEVLLKDGYKGPAYALASVYYLFWIAMIAVLAGQSQSLGTEIISSVLLYIVPGFFFVLSFVLSAVFIFKFKKPLKEGNKK